MDSGVGEKGFIFLWLTSILVTRIQVSEAGPMGPLDYLNIGDACRTKCDRMVIYRLILY